MNRRTCLKAGTAALLAPHALAAADEAVLDFDPAAPLPHKAAFAPFESIYLNSASQHPVSLGGRQAIGRYLDFKSFATDSDYSTTGTYQAVLEQYARLINASPDEVCYVQSTTVGENLVMKALGLPRCGARIVTDELHYLGSLPTYAEIAKQGVDVVTLRATDDGRIAFEQFERAIDRRTDLVCISLVSMVNGFEHDLRSICELAHANGALVYADVVHAVGSIPFDVRPSGVDFCSAASYKWLMGEQGLGFFYARKDRLGQIRRPWFGHYQLAALRGTGFPNPDRDDGLSEYGHFDGARGYFAMGSQSNIVAALLGHSLDYLHAVGVQRIRDYRQPLIDRLQESLPSLGYAPLTPEGSRTPIVSFRHDGDVAGLRKKLAKAGVTVTVAAHHLRLSPSVFNDLDDIERTIDALR